MPAALAACAAAVAMAGCRLPDTGVAPPVAVPGRFSAAGPAPLPRRWWTAFDDEGLNRLVAAALRGNFSLRTAWDRLDAARATAAAGAAPLWPALDGTAGTSWTARRAPPAGQTEAMEYGLGLAASYEVDLWGRVRSTYDAARLDARASAEDLSAAAITLTAEVAGTWYLLIEQAGQLELLKEQVATNEKYLEVITLRFRRGRVSATDVLQQRQLVESTKGQQALVASSRKVLEHQLALLSGRPPGAAAGPLPEGLPGLPALPRAGLPAAVVRRRPDVRAAELRVRAADRRVAAAIADQFPRLSLSLGAETTAERLRDLFDNWLASLAANVTAPLFDGGLRRAEVARTKAVVSERLHAYGDVVLTALKEIEDALAQEAEQARFVESLRKQLELSKQAADQLLINYTKGSAEFVRYLTALLSYQQLQRTHLQARRELVQFRINLYRALAGGWPLPRPDRAEVPRPAEKPD